MVLEVVKHLNTLLSDCQPFFRLVCDPCPFDPSEIKYSPDQPNLDEWVEIASSNYDYV